MEYWYFGEQLKKKMNEYMNQIIHESINIILIRDLRRAKMPDHRLKFIAEDPLGGELVLKNVWVEDLSSIGKGGVNYLTFNYKDIVFTSHLQIWWNLQFNSDFILNATKPVVKGNIEGQINSIVYFLKIRVNYLGSRTATLEELQPKCLGGVNVEVKGLDDSQNWMTEGISEGAVGVFKRYILEDVKNIFQRSLEDSISNNNVSKFIPEWNYEKTYDESQTRKYRENFTLCDNTETMAPPIASVFEKDKIVGFEEVLPQIKTLALRLSLQQSMKGNMNGYLDKVWEGAWNHIINRYEQPKLRKYFRLFHANDRQGESTQVVILLFNGSNLGFTSTNKLEYADIVYGENDSVLLLFTQRMNVLEVKFDYNLTTHHANLSGSIEGRIESVNNLLKSRFDLNTKRLTIEDYDLHCVEAARMEVHGLDEEYSWLHDHIKEEATGIFSGHVIDDFWTLMSDVLQDAIPKDAIKNYLPKWMYKEKLYEIATDNQENKERPLEDLKECSYEDFRKTEEQDAEYEGDLPFIQTEAERWSFHGQTTNKIDGYRRNVWSLSSIFMMSNNLGKVRLPNVTRSIRSTDPNGSEHNVKINLENGLVEDISNLDSQVLDHIEYRGTEMILASRIKFGQYIKLFHDFKASILDEVHEGNVHGTVNSLTYDFKARIYLENKTVRLEEIQLRCIGDLKIDVRGIADEFDWLEDSVSKLATEIFLGPTLDDVEKIIRIAFQNAITEIDIGFYHYLPEWDYRKNYGPKQMMNESYFQKCVPSF